MSNYADVWRFCEQQYEGIQATDARFSGSVFISLADGRTQYIPNAFVETWEFGRQLFYVVVPEHADMQVHSEDDVIQCHALKRDSIAKYEHRSATCNDKKCPVC